MILFSANNLEKYFAEQPVLDGATCELRPGEKVGLVGPNGTGKTTFLRILAQQLEPDGGQLELHPAVRIGYLEQQPEFPTGATVAEVARAALSELTDLSHEAQAIAEQIAAAADANERTRLGEKFDRLQHELERRGGYHLDHKIERVLGGLGFSSAMHDQPVAQLSGGQQNRLLLAQLLLAGPDVLLLDEPSNHLDIDATEWLEKYLSDSPAAMVIVSHDRYLLDRVTDRTWELFRGTIATYKGNFSAYWQQKDQRLAVERRTFERQQEEIEKLEDFIRRNHHGLKHAQAEDRRKKLERIERVEPPREIAAPPMGFPPASRTGDIVMRGEHLSKAYDQPLFQDVGFQIERGQRWGILGPNGTGKTTMLRCLLGHVTPDEGEVILGTGVKLAYFDQQLAGLDSDTELVEAVRPPVGEMNEPQRRNLLARFGLTGDAAFQKVGSLSGGERNRAALAHLAAQEANLLILDEPTNHLDLWARDALERSLKAFEGTLIFVSHDRYFLNRVADHLLVFEPGRVREVKGNYDFYLHLVSEGLATGDRPGSAGVANANSTSTANEKKNGGKKNRDKAAPSRRRKFPYRKVADIETDIFQCETRIEALHHDLASPEILRDGDRVKEIQQQLSVQQATLAQLYEHWEEASELN